ncbi:MAG: hypothetical protein ACHQRM_05610 [Bacteroidia bacterium]
MPRILLILLLVCGFNLNISAQRNFSDSTKWILGIGAGPSNEFRQIASTPESKFPQVLSHLNAQTPKNSIFASFFFDLRVYSTNFYLCTGLNYEDKGFKTNQVTDTSYSYNKYGVTGVIPYSHSEIYHYHYFGVPLLVKYKFTYKKLGLIVGGGLILEAGYYLYMDRTSSITILDNTGGSVASNKSYEMDATLSYRLNKHLFVMIQGIYSRCLNYKDYAGFYPKNSSLGNVWCRFYSFAFPIGIAYRK